MGVDNILAEFRVHSAQAAEGKFFIALLFIYFYLFLLLKWIYGSFIKLVPRTPSGR